MKYVAFVTDDKDKIGWYDIPINEKLDVGDFILFYPEEDSRDNNNKNFTNEEVNNGISLLVEKRVYSTIDGMMYYCKRANHSL